jgi:hypothetical protein
MSHDTVHALMQQMSCENALLRAKIERLERELRCRNGHGLPLGIQINEALSKQDRRRLLKCARIPPWPASISHTTQLSLSKAQEDLLAEKSTVFRGKPQKTKEKSGPPLLLRQRESAAFASLQQEGLLEMELSMERALLLHLHSGNREVRLALRVHIASLLLPRGECQEEAFVQFCVALDSSINSHVDTAKEAHDLRSAFLKAAADRVEGVTEDMTASVMFSAK